MATSTTVSRKQVLQELNDFPEEYLPYLLQMMRTLRESVTLKAASESFRQGWKEAQQGDVQPLSELWEDLDVE